MNPGRLRHQVDIEQKQTTKDSSGGMVDTWSALHSNVWAEVFPVSGNEGPDGKEEQSGEFDHRVTMRYLSGITPSNRINYKSRIFDIKGVKNIGERDRWMIIFCKEQL